MYFDVMIFVRCRENRGCNARTVEVDTGTEVAQQTDSIGVLAHQEGVDRGKISGELIQSRAECREDQTMIEIVVVVDETIA